MFEWDWDGAIVDDPSVEDLNSEFGKTMVGITYMRCSKIVYDGPSKAQGNDFENAVAVSMLCSKIEELSPGLVAECIGLGLADLTKRGIVLGRKH